MMVKTYGIEYAWNTLWATLPSVSEYCDRRSTGSIVMAV